MQSQRISNLKIWQNIWYFYNTEVASPKNLNRHFRGHLRCIINDVQIQTGLTILETGVGKYHRQWSCLQIDGLQTTYGYVSTRFKGYIQPSRSAGKHFVVVELNFNFRIWSKAKNLSNLIYGDYWKGLCIFLS